MDCNSLLSFRYLLAEQTEQVCASFVSPSVTTNTEVWMGRMLVFVFASMVITNTHTVLSRDELTEVLLLHEYGHIFISNLEFDTVSKTLKS